MSEREAKDEELSRGGATSRRYLAHCKRLTKLMLKLQRAGEAGSGETDEHVWFKWLDDDETSVVRVRMRETGSVRGVWWMVGSASGGGGDTCSVSVGQIVEP